MTQYTEYSATVKVATGRSVPRLNDLRKTLTKLAKTIPADAEIVIERYQYQYGIDESGPRYNATRLVAKWSRYE